MNPQRPAESHVSGLQRKAGSPLTDLTGTPGLVIDRG